MRRARLIITLEEDAVFSERAASEGGHHSLDYVPGASLMGVVARHYRNYRSEAHCVFQSGKVRFGDGLPLTPSNLPGVPMPLAWHETKAGPAGHVNGICIPGNIWNLLNGPIPGNAQPKQMGAGYVTCDARWLQPKMNFSIKTAINPNTHRAADEQFFGYESIAAGERFIAEVEADDGLSEEAWNNIRQTLAGCVRLGRSRTAQYSMAQIVWSDSTQPLFLPTTPNGETVDLLALSDLVLEDDFGRPTLYPMGSLLGIAGASFDSAASFLRTRIVNNYNAFYGSYESERQVICRGSVIRLRKPGGFNASDLASLAAGVGIDRQRGFGRVWVSPRMLLGIHPTLFEPALANDSVPPEPSTANRDVLDPFLTLLDWRTRSRRGPREAIAAGQADARDLLNKWYADVRAFNGLEAHHPAGPGRSQWSRVREKSSNAEDWTGIKNQLFDGKASVCRMEDKNGNQKKENDWGLHLNEKDTIHSVFLTHLDKKNASHDDYLVDYVMAFASEASKLIQRKELL